MPRRRVGVPRRLIRCSGGWSNPSRLLPRQGRQGARQLVPRRAGRHHPRAAAKVDDYVEEYLNDKDASAPPPEHPISSQVDGELRELRVRFARTRYRVLYRRSGLLVLLLLLHMFEKDTDKLPARERELAVKRFADFKARMAAEPRRRPRAAGHDAPPKTRGDRTYQT